MDSTSPHPVGIRFFAPPSPEHSRRSGGFGSLPSTERVGRHSISIPKHCQLKMHHFKEQHNSSPTIEGTIEARKAASELSSLKAASPTLSPKGGGKLHRSPRERAFSARSSLRVSSPPSQYVGRSSTSDTMSMVGSTMSMIKLAAPPQRMRPRSNRGKKTKAKSKERYR